ncbi:photosystem ii protein d1 [Phtheirospermum japonicum]|uniref:Photosystem ii protein d1 n=1 Tax=Phtheirospermum japonicum TaxID=374723 RepID=A0A830CHY2_9LAMI|nr:photosystem ii protein d1 [Phtheirospermum japonicum]
MHPFHMLGVAGVFGGSLFSVMHGSLVTSSLIRETTENEGGEFVRITGYEGFVSFGFPSKFRGIAQRCFRGKISLEIPSVSYFRGKYSLGTKFRGVFFRGKFSLGFSLDLPKTEGFSLKIEGKIPRKLRFFL